MSDAVTGRQAGRLPKHGPCFVCGSDNSTGLGLDWFSDAGIVYASSVFDVRCQGPPAHVHGGASAALLDEAMGAALWHAAHPALLASLTVNYHQPIPLGVSVRIEGWLERVEGRKCFAAGQIRLPSGLAAVSATGLYVQAPEEFLSKFGSLVGLGPG